MKLWSSILSKPALVSLHFDSNRSVFFLSTAIKSLCLFQNRHWLYETLNINCHQIRKLNTMKSWPCSQCSSSRILMPCSQRPVWLICSATINYVTLDYVITYRRARLGILTTVRRISPQQPPLFNISKRLKLWSSTLSKPAF